MGSYHNPYFLGAFSGILQEIGDRDGWRSFQRAGEARQTILKVIRGHRFALLPRIPDL
jgi:hypothetical protein